MKSPRWRSPPSLTVPWSRRVRLVLRLRRDRRRCWRSQRRRARLPAARAGRSGPCLRLRRAYWSSGGSRASAEWPGHRCPGRARDRRWRMGDRRLDAVVADAGHRLTNGETSRYRVVVEHDGMDAPSVIVEATPDAQWGTRQAAGAAGGRRRHRPRRRARPRRRRRGVADPRSGLGSCRSPATSWSTSASGSDGWEHSEVDAAAPHRLCSNR